MLQLEIVELFLFRSEEIRNYSSQRTVETYLRVWVLPRWGEYRLSEVRTVAVESWLRSLSLANARKAKNRAIVHQHVGEMKTETSQRPVPMDGALAAALLEWSGQTPYQRPEDWVFASPRMNGKQPYWPESIMKCYVRPVAKRLGITKKIGWHTFRRTLATLLASEENAKTTPELMRHANAGVTMNLYAQALTPVKRSALKGGGDDPAGRENNYDSYLFHAEEGSL